MAKSHVGLPRIDASGMIFARYRPGDYIEKSSLLNLYQPVQKIEVVPELIIVPGLGFSIQGYRIGYGYGYYDKYLDKISASKPITIGVCFHDNLFEYLPFEEHDHQFDYVVTDKIIIKR
jgi:5-formyltetrahydrofolate cyclo-ligase